jgi:GGDEF domain-containing protein
MEFLKKHKILFYLPIFLSAPLLYTSQWTHLVYWFNEDNLYIAADSIMCYYPYFLFFGYVILFFILFSRYTHYGTTERKGILICIIVSTIGVIVHLILDIVVDYSTLFASLLLIYYLSLSLLTAKQDTLTHLLNRQCYYADMEKRKDWITGVVSADMNDLKKINDTQGHAAGDLALETVAKCLLETGTRKKRVYRIGGDEFAVFYLGTKTEDIVRDIEEMRGELAKTPYVCAFGF